MSRKRTVRRVWQKVNPITFAMSGCAITPRDELDKLLARELSALDDFTHGRACLQQWFDLASLVNICETLAHEGIGPEALEPCALAQDELIAAAKRFQKSQRMGLTGPGIQHMRDVIEYHDLQRASIPRSQYEKLIRLTANRVKSGYQTVDIGNLETA
jgi:hypothetical protein